VADQLFKEKNAKKRTNNDDLNLICSIDGH